MGPTTSSSTLPSAAKLSPREMILAKNGLLGRNTVDMSSFGEKYCRYVKNWGEIEEKAMYAINTINLHRCWFTAKSGFQIQNIVFTDVGFHLKSGFKKFLCSQMLVLTLILDSRKYCVNQLFLYCIYVMIWGEILQICQELGRNTVDMSWSGEKYYRYVKNWGEILQIYHDLGRNTTDMSRTREKYCRYVKNWEEVLHICHDLGRNTTNMSRIGEKYCTQ